MPDSGFSKKSRLLCAADFSPVFQKPDARVSNRHILFLARNNEHSTARLGTVVSRKNARLAVQRNRIKRIFRESFRVRQHEFATIDLVMLARPGLQNLSKKEVRQLTDRLLDELQKRLTA